MILDEQISKRTLSPLLKWAGGKEQELKFILPNLPRSFNSYFEPFVGGGAVFTAINANRSFINDKSHELMSLYANIANKDNSSFFLTVELIITVWERISKVVDDNTNELTALYKLYSESQIDEKALTEQINNFIDNSFGSIENSLFAIYNSTIGEFIIEVKKNTLNKIKRMKKIEITKSTLPLGDIINNIETGFKSGFYMYMRKMYNEAGKRKIEEGSFSSIFYFIRNFAYSGMFRYNSSGHFNVPFGGIGYNRKNLKKKLDYFKSEGLQKLFERTSFDNLDYEDFLKKYSPKSNDFIFLDPPYDSEFSTYAQNQFTTSDQKRLANYLIKDCKAKWMLVIKNSELISELYLDKGLNIHAFDKTYLVSFMNRNDKKAEHLMICNY